MSANIIQDGLPSINSLSALHLIVRIPGLFDGSDPYTHYFSILIAGTQVCVFVMTFAVFGAAGSSIPFPTWWGNDMYPDK